MMSVTDHNALHNIAFRREGERGKERKSGRVREREGEWEDWEIEGERG